MNIEASKIVKSVVERLTLVLENKTGTSQVGATLTGSKSAMLLKDAQDFFIEKFAKTWQDTHRVPFNLRKTLLRFGYSKMGHMGAHFWTYVTMKNIEAHYTNLDAFSMRSFN